MSFVRNIILTWAILLLTTMALAQEVNSVPEPIQLHGALSVTNNGFSFVPTFTLGKPAAILDLSVSHKRLSFDPQLRFSLEGKPWSIVFMWRYKLIRQDKFQLQAGSHLPALAFSSESYEENGIVNERIRVQRFLPFDLAANYKVSQHLDLGMYYLLAFGPKETTTKLSNFITFRVNWHDIPLGNRLRLKINPQVYYLRLDDLDGFFTAGNLVLSLKDFPFSIGTTMNQAIKTNIDVKHYDWNVSVIYSFGSEYLRKG